ncbi:MAG TPA: damage-inducible protein DinB, partial [Chitinophagaceae bacterium]|nr:damage-inducible protein DinB [Chitinophagaceae bacterium]
MKKLMQKVVIVMPIVLFITGSQIKSQALTADDIKAQMVKEWERAKTYTVDYLNTMPADKYSFVAADSIRSFAQQMLHLAGGNFFLMMNATDQKLPFTGNPDMENSPGAQKKDSVMFYVTASYDYCINAVKTTDLAKWG